MKNTTDDYNATAPFVFMPSTGGAMVVTRRQRKLVPPLLAAVNEADD